MGKFIIGQISPNFKNLIGEVFDRLTIVALSDERAKGGRCLWICQCSCGNEIPTLVSTSNLRSGTTRSCGCLQRELSFKRATTHGMSKSTEYRSWYAMRKRCNNPTDRCYHLYGRLGTRVCEGWLASFENFYNDMGPKPGPEYSIDRADNSGNYSCGHCNECVVNAWPMNCRWANVKIQNRNRKSNVPIFYQGRVQIIVEWAEEFKINSSTLEHRLKKGWSTERAFTEPVRHNKPKIIKDS